MLGGLVISFAANAADAREALYLLSIAPKPYADALIDLGTEADVSILGTSACGSGGQVGLEGRFTLREALGRLTVGAPCTFRILDPRTVRILASGPPPAAESRPATLVTGLLVTATKRLAGTNQLPASISVIPRDQITLADTADIADAAAQVSGVLTTNLGPGRDKVILRGLSDGAFTGHARSTVGSYLDDIPINYNAPDPDLRLVDVERIEVVRGPQGALYGSGSLSGVYRIVTRKPNLLDFEAGVAGSAAWTKGGSPSQEIEGYVSTPVVRDLLGVRAVAYHDVEGGYIDNLSLRLANIDRTTRDGGRFALRLQPSDAWQADLTVATQRLRSNDTHYTTPAAGPDQRLGLVREDHKNDFDEASLTIRGELGPASLRSSLALIEHTFSSDYDATAVLAQPDLFASAPNSIGVYREKTRVRMLVEDTVLRSSRPGRLSWLLGLYAAATTESSPSSLDIQPPAGSLDRAYEEQRRDRLREFAIYGEAGYQVAPGWIVSLGGRLFDTEVRTTSAVLVDHPGDSRNFAGRNAATGFSPKVSLQHETGSGGLLYALYSEGYRPGGFNTGGFLYPIRPNRVTFAPDRLRNLEVGYKSSFLDHHLALHASVFYDLWSGIQSDQYRPSGLPFTVNVGDARILGLETEIGYEWDFGLSLQASGLLIGPKLDHPNHDFAERLTSSLPSVPKVSGGLLAIYERPLPRDLSLRLTAETSYVGRSALSFDKSQSAEMGAYARTKLAVQLVGEGWRAMLFVTNPQNTAGNTFAYGNPFTFGQVRQSTPQRPRTIGIRLSAEY